MKLKIIFAIVFLLLFPVIYLVLTVIKEPDIKKGYLSPVPDFIKNVLSASDTTESVWDPSIESIYDTGIKNPVISARSAIIYDLTTERLLYSKNIKTRLPIASLTKIMTALITLEYEDIDKSVIISSNASRIGENSMGLSEGEVISIKELLYGLILPSGNDAAEALAEGSNMGRSAFLSKMNSKAEELGAVDTHFTNPSGLEGDGDQYSTAYDLLLITRYALQNETFKRLVSDVEYSIAASRYHKAFYLYNDTNLLTSYPGVKGVKTGFTDEAGLCLVTYLDYEGHQIIGVILNSQNRRQEMKELLDYSLKTLGIKPPEHQ